MVDKTNADADLKLKEVLLRLAETNEKDNVFQLIFEYLSENISGVECSIFLVDPTTDELKIADSTYNFTEEEKLKAVYKRETGGFTIWPLINKKLLYIEDQTKLDELNINPKPIHMGMSGGKPCETKEIGPFMAAPIMSEGYAIGVIRLPGNKELRTNYLPEERELFRVFASRISASIENSRRLEKLDRLIKLYSKIGQSNELEILLNDVVDGVLAVVEGGGCSVFLLDERSQNGERFVLKKTRSANEAFNKQIGSLFYTKDGEGLTAYAATTGEIVNVRNLNDPAEINKIGVDTYPHPTHKKSICEINNIGPFLAAPIKYKKRVIGILRIPRYKYAKPFGKLDEILIKAFADHLALVIMNIKGKQELEKIKSDLSIGFRLKFSDALIEMCNELSKIHYKDNIKKFFESCGSSCSTDDQMNEQILNSLQSLWTHSYNQIGDFGLIREFQSYEYLLFKLPRYRDHFIHQYQVFLVGSVIIDKIYNLAESMSVDNFANYYYKSLSIEAIDKKITEIAWLVTSTFHDVAYPIEKSDALFNKFFKDFMGLDEQFINSIDLGKIACNDKYTDLIDQLSDLYASLNKKQWTYNEKAEKQISTDLNFRHSLNFCLRNKDHGLLGALILLEKSKKEGIEFSQIVYPSALAIALHNKFLSNLKSENNYCNQNEKLIRDLISKEEIMCQKNCGILRFEENPLAFLLIYCDLIQEWGREQEDLSELVDSDKTSHEDAVFLGDLSARYREEEAKPRIPTLTGIKVHYKNSMIHVETKIEVDGSFFIDKVKETRNKFHRLRSDKIIFSLIIESKNPNESSTQCCRVPID